MANYQDVIAMLHELDILKSLKKNAKIDYLQSNPVSQILRETLKLVYDPYINTGLTSKTLLKTVPNAIQAPITDYATLLHWITENNTGTLIATNTVAGYIAKFPAEYQDALCHIFGNDLKIGITAKSLNKVFGESFIRDFGVQLAFPFAKYGDKLDGEEFILTQKLDGHRAVCQIDNGHGQFYTRQGIPINGLNAQIKVLINLATYIHEPQFVFDGELLLKNPTHMSTKDLFRETSSALRSQNADKSDIVFNIFDGVTLQEFLAGQSHNLFNTRKQTLLEMPKDQTQHITVIPNLYVGHDLSKIHELQTKLVVPNDWEGLMLNLSAGQYQTKRSRDLLKIKTFFNADVKVLDVFEGQGNFANTLGGVIIDYKGYQVRVGSGFDTNQRDYFWHHPEDIVGKIIDVQYFEETHNQNNTDLSLRFPVFKAIRDDKAVTSYEA